MSRDIELSTHFVIVSGEDIDLAKAEVDSLIGLTGVNAEISWSGQLALIESEDSPVGFLLARGATIKEAGIVIGEGELSENSFDWLSDDEIECHIDPSKSFSVRTKSLAVERYVEQREKLSALLGARIMRVTGASVSLNQPDINVLVLLTSERILVCISNASRLRHALQLREPGRKDFFHPSMMNSYLARTLCNLAGVQPSTLVLDPFCGGGGILCEAAIIGARTVGWDLNWRLILGARKNLDSISDSEACLLQADSRLPPLRARCFDAIVTDPPYGRASSTRGTKARALVQTFIEHVPDLVKGGGRLCVCGSREMGITGIMSDLDFDVLYQIPVYVHRGLTREVVTVQL
ncbi:MAG: hypothetical protein ACFFD6_00035 [Candidatus Thorarchaeota archaeon]